MRFCGRITSGALTLALAAIPSGVAVAQTTDIEGHVPEGRRRGSPSSTSRARSQETVPTDDDAVQRLRGAQAVCDVRFDNPRVSGTARTDIDYDCQAEAGCVTWGQQEIVGPDGGWSGSFEGLIDPAFTERTVAVLSGTGSYAGMTFVVMAVAPLDEAPSVVGLVYEGGAPPLP